MNTSAEAADQVVRMTLNGVEVAAKISGAGAKQLALLLYAILKDQKKTKGKTRLSNMLRSGKELKVFAVKDQDLQKFCEEAKKYGVLYCVLKDKNAKDGLTDIMVRAEDASKVNRIFERFNLATVDIAAVRGEIERSRAEAQAQQAAGMQAPERTPAEKTADAQFVDQLLQPAPTREQAQTQNPTEGRNAKSRQSEPTSRPKKSTAKGISDPADRSARPSVRQELSDIRDEQRQRAAASRTEPKRQQPVQQHKAPPKKPKKTKER